MECRNMSANVFLRPIPKHGELSLIRAHNDAVMINYVQPHRRVFKEVLQISLVCTKELLSCWLFCS